MNGKLEESAWKLLGTCVVWAIVFAVCCEIGTALADKLSPAVKPKPITIQQLQERLDNTDEEVARLKRQVSYLLEKAAKR